MPKSKRSKIISLTAVKAKRKEIKSGLVDAIREGVDRYDTIVVFAYDNMRTSKFKDVRSAWADSRFFLGKNAVIRKALGDSEEDAFRPGLDALAADLVGQVGLLFTSRPLAEVLAYFTEFTAADFARAGFVPASTVTLPAGRLADMPHTMAETLSKLGMPTQLDRGVVVLPRDHTLCTAGSPITADQGKLLKHFGHQLAAFKLRPLSAWTGGVYTAIDEDGVPAAAAAGAGRRAAGAAMDEDGSSEEDYEEEEEEAAPAVVPVRKAGKAAAVAGPVDISALVHGKARKQGGKTKAAAAADSDDGGMVSMFVASGVGVGASAASGPAPSTKAHKGAKGALAAAAAGAASVSKGSSSSKRRGARGLAGVTADE